MCWFMIPLEWGKVRRAWERAIKPGACVLLMAVVLEFMLSSLSAL